MIRSLVTSLLLFVSGLALANSPCDVISGKQNYPPLKIKDGVACFVEQPFVIDKDKGYYGVETVVYTIAKGHEPIKAEDGELPSNGGNSLGIIVDAFTLDIDHDGIDEVVVIQFVEVSKGLVEPNSSGKFYDVLVFSQTERGLRQNKHASKWFGFAYSWFTNGKKKVYEYPYLTQKSVRNALSSSFISLMYRDEAIPVIVKRKSFLYEHSMLYGNPKKYLIAGDKATVDEYTAGWCRITYTGGKQPLQMWIMCDALEVDKKGKEQ